MPLLCSLLGNLKNSSFEVRTTSFIGWVRLGRWGVIFSHLLKMCVKVSMNCDCCCDPDKWVCMKLILRVWMAYSKLNSSKFNVCCPFIPYPVQIHKPGLEVIKLEFILRLKVKHNDWLLADMCPQAANHCALF